MIFQRLSRPIQLPRSRRRAAAPAVEGPAPRRRRLAEVRAERAVIEAAEALADYHRAANGDEDQFVSLVPLCAAVAALREARK